MLGCLVRSVPDLPDDRGRTAGAEEELADLAVDVLITAMHQKRYLLDHEDHEGRFREGLWLDLGAVAVVDAVVPALEDLVETVLHLSLGICDRLPAQVRG